jgi:hypothetical protein
LVANLTRLEVAGELIKHISGYVCEGVSRDSWHVIRKLSGRTHHECGWHCPIGWALDGTQSGRSGELAYKSKYILYFIYLFIYFAADIAHGH